MPGGNEGGVPGGCRWHLEHSLQEWMELFDRLPREARDRLNYEDLNGDTCVHCTAKALGIRPARNPKGCRPSR